MLKLLLLFIFSLASFAQEIGADRKLFRLNRVKIEGLKKLEPQVIIDKLDMTPGKFLTSKILNEDLKRVYGLKFFEAVEIHKSGNDVIFKVKEKPVIRNILVSGNSELSDKDIQDAIETKTFNIVDEATLKRDVEAIQKLYEDKGYFLSQVSTKIKDDKNGGVVIIFDILEFDKVKVKKINFLGNKEISSDQLKNFMITREDSTFSFLNDSGSFKEFNFKTDLERLMYFYRTKGFLQVNIGEPVVTVSEDRRWLFITISVAEGPKFGVESVSFEGDLIYSIPEFEEITTLKANETYDEEKLRQDILKLTEKYQDQGYAFANVSRDLKPVGSPDTKNPKVSLTYNFSKGKKARIGRITIKGNSKTRDKVVRRELRIYEGMEYSGSKVRISKENVNRLGFFEPGSVVFNSKPRSGSSDLIDINISVAERQTGQISLGAGYSTQESAFFQGSIKQNNFRGMGQNLAFTTNLSKQQQNFSLGLTEPYLNDSLWTLGGLIYHNKSRLITGFESLKQGFEITVGHPLGEYTRGFLRYGFENTELDNVTNPTIDKNLENGIASGIEASIVHDRRNNIFEPTKGYYIRASSEFVGLGFNHRWLNFGADVRFYYPIYKEFVLRTRFKTDKVLRTTDRKIPRTEKLAMGGSRDMRGFPIQGIGRQEKLTDLADGNLKWFNQGGLHSVLATVEIEHPLIKEAGLKWAIFYDVGNVYDRFMGENGDYSLRQDFGFGFRWFSPIGILRFEFGFPINRRTSEIAGVGPAEAANQFFFDIGQTF